MRDVPIRGEMIRLGELLKLAGVVGTGGEAKYLLASTEVRVNGELESRRGGSCTRGTRSSSATRRCASSPRRRGGREAA